MTSTDFFKRVFDLVLAMVLLLIFILPVIILLIIVRLTSKGPAIHWSKRIGTNNDIFLMPKIRTMHIDTPQVATDILFSASNKYLTPIGKFMRKTSCDELPQIWSVLKGDMSIVGPRPALFNQYHLTDLRTKQRVHTLKPGITGWAQVNGRDICTDQEKVDLDEYYLKNKSIYLDFKILVLTAVHVLKSTNVTH